MLLTKSQQKHITKCLNSAAKQIREEQEKEREEYVKKKEGQDQPSPWERGMHVGKQSAYEASYHIAKTAAEESYGAEYQGADQEIESVCKQLEAQALFLEQNGLEAQAALTKRFVQRIRLILHLSE